MNTRDSILTAPANFLPLAWWWPPDRAEELVIIVAAEGVPSVCGIPQETTCECAEQRILECQEKTP